MSDEKLPSYGAVASPKDEEANAVDQSFDAANTYYLRNTTRWSFKKVMLIVVPIIGAALIIGGFALFLLRDFSHLYPGHTGDKSYYTGGGSEHVVSSDSSSSGGGGSDARNPPRTPPAAQDDDDSTEASISTSKAKKSKSNPDDDAGANCAVHPDCTGLIGKCCPTPEGVQLECCRN